MFKIGIKDMLDAAILVAARRECPRLIDLSGRIGEITSGWLVPCSDLVRARVDALEAGGFLMVEGGGTMRIRGQAVSTREGLRHARRLIARASHGDAPANAAWETLRRELEASDEQACTVTALLTANPALKRQPGGRTVHAALPG